MKKGIPNIVKSTDNNFNMCGSRGVHKLKELINSIRDVQSSNYEIYKAPSYLLIYVTFDRGSPL